MAFVRSCLRSLHGGDGVALASLLRLDNDALSSWAAAPALAPHAFSQAGEQASLFLAAHATAATLAASGAWPEAYDTFAAEGVQPFVRWFREQDDAGVAVPVMQQIATNLYDLASKAEKASGSMAAAAEDSRLSNAGMKLQSCFSEAFNPKKDKDKKMACLSIVIAMFRLYFSINTLHLTRNLVNSMSARNAPDFDSFPASQRATYRYYTGRLLVFEDRFAEAEEHLAYALRHAPRASHSAVALRNRRRVLAYLIPVRMLLGRMPSDELLRMHGMDNTFGPVKRACVTGDLRAFNDVMEATTVSHIQLGTFLLMERLRQFVLRTLLKRVHLVTQPTLPPTNFQLDLHQFQRALAMCASSDEDAPDIEEAECLVVTLIYRKAVKGYISHKLRKLVLSKKDAFPSQWS